jgi:acyl carrier protein
MGLDAVEIVMKVEETFDIAIEDCEAEKILTPHALIELVMSKVGRTDRAVCLTQRAFHRFRASLIRNAGFKREQIKPDVLMTQLFVPEIRKTLLLQLLNDIGLSATPEFVRPRWVVNLAVGFSIGVGIFTGIVLLHAPPSSNFVINLIVVSPFLSGFFAALFTGWLATQFTRILCNDFKPALATVGDFSRWIVAHGPNVVGAPPGQWSREQVEIKIREIVIDALGCEKDYREDANFLKDLGLS